MKFQEHLLLKMNLQKKNTNTSWKVLVKSHLLKIILCLVAKLVRLALILLKSRIHLIRPLPMMSGQICKMQSVQRPSQSNPSRAMSIHSKLRLFWEESTPQALLSKTTKRSLFGGLLKFALIVRDQRPQSTCEQISARPLLPKSLFQTPWTSP